MTFLTRPDLVSSDIYLPHPETGTTSGYYSALDSWARKAKFTQAFKTASLEYHVEIDWDGVRPLTGAERRTRLERCWAKAGFPKRYWPTVGERERVGPGEAFQGGSEVTKKKETRSGRVRNDIQFASGGLRNRVCMCARWSDAV